MDTSTLMAIFITLFSVAMPAMGFAIVFFLGRGRGSGADSRPPLVEETVDGVTLGYARHKPTRRSPPWCEVVIACRGNGTLYIKREGSVERFFKRLNINREIKSGDPAFDAAFYIISDENDFPRRMLRDREARCAIEALFALGFTDIAINPETISTLIDPCDGQPLESEGAQPPALVREAAPHLDALARHLPPHNPAASVRQPDNYGIPTHRRHPLSGPWSARRRFGYGLALLLLGIGIASFIAGTTSYPTLEAWPLIGESLAWGLPPLLFFLWGCVRLLRDRPASHIDVLYSGAILVFAYPLLSLGLGSTLNGALDNSPPASHTLPVLNTQRSKGKDGDHYSLTVASWREGRREEQIAVDRVDYDRANSGLYRLQLTTRAGRLGYEWLEAYRLVK